MFTQPSLHNGCDSRTTCQPVRAAKGDDSKGAGGGLLGELGAALSSGTQKLTAGLGAGTQKLKSGGSSSGGALDNSTVFVAGATGRLGARIVRELLAQGFKVRAGVRNLDKADVSWARAGAAAVAAAVAAGSGRSDAAGPGTSGSPGYAHVPPPHDGGCRPARMPTPTPAPYHAAVLHRHCL